VEDAWGIIMSFRLLRRTLSLATPFLLAAAPASAHHVMGGRTPSTFMEGLLSGLAHPVIGPDHLAFLLAVGVAVGVGGLNLALPVVFVAAMAIGVVVHVNGIGLPAAEIIVALSVLLTGLLIAYGRALPVAVWATLFAVAGLFHGYALGESIYGAETTPLDAYLLGLVVIQGAVTVGIALAMRRMGAGISEMAPRLAGALVVAVGLIALVGQFVLGA
jgi:urease accessory protein